MKKDKCRKCGSENIFHITINPNRDELETNEVECRDCGFNFRERTLEKIKWNNFEKRMDDRYPPKPGKGYEYLSRR